MKKTLVKNATPQEARQKYMVLKQYKIQPSKSQVQNTKVALSSKYMIEAKNSQKCNLDRHRNFLAQNTLVRHFLNQCKIHQKNSLAQNTRNKKKISQKSNKKFGVKNTLQIIQSKIHYSNQCKIHPPKLLVYSHALYTISKKGMTLY